MPRAKKIRTPWCDCKVAYSVDNADPFDDVTLLDGRLPPGWELNEVDGAGARWMAVFRVGVMLTIEDGERVQALLVEVGANRRPRSRKR